MRHIYFSLAAVCAGLAFSTCNCGSGAGSGAVGDPCMQNNECQSSLCGADKKCAPAVLPDGGIVQNDAGMGTLGDGGTCEKLQCQIPACSGTSTTTVTGKVYDPGGSVPLYNAIVYVPNAPLKALPAGPTCSACGALVSGNPVAIALTGPDGAFTLSNVPAGANIPLVLQIGKWRRQVTLPQVNPCTANPLTDAAITRLPRNQSEGDLPLMAIASGNADGFECLLRKIGISDSEFTTATGSGRVHYFVQNGLDLAGGAPQASTLWTDANTLNKYDVVILPCEGRENAKPRNAVRNMVDYTNLGGRVFATHYSYVWTRVGWPQSAAWQPGLPDLYSTTFDVTVDQTFPKGQAFAQWLTNVGASPTQGTLGILESRHDVTAVNPGSTRWLYGEVPSSNPATSIQHLTYNTPFLDAGTQADGGAAPQCGRVVFSDFHVTAGATNGGNTFPDACVSGPLTGQEKALEFMLFDLSACVQDDKDGPSACNAVGQSCTSDAQCCAGTLCVTASGTACTGAGCTCQPGVN